jgi:hypothetical protein
MEQDGGEWMVPSMKDSRCLGKEAEHMLPNLGEVGEVVITE